MSESSFIAHRLPVFSGTRRLAFPWCLVLALAGCQGGCHQQPGTPPTPPSDAAKSLSASECDALQSRRTVVISALENEQFAEAVTALATLQAELPGDPFVTRNLAVCRLMALRVNQCSPEEATEAMQGLLAGESDRADAQWLAGRIQLALAEGAKSEADRSRWTEEGLSHLARARELAPETAAIPYEYFLGGRYSQDPDIVRKSREALAAAAKLAPANLFLLTEVLLDQLERKDAEVLGTLELVQEPATSLREGVLRRTRVDLTVLLADAKAAVEKADWRTAQGKLRSLSAVLRPEERAQSDRRMLSPHPLEFLQQELTTVRCPLPPAVEPLGDVRFVVSESQPAQNTTGDWTAVTMSDVDLDGRLDIVAAAGSVVTVFRNDAVRGWQNSTEVTPDGSVRGVFAVDLDRDATPGGATLAPEICQEADPDLLVFGSFGIRVFRNERQEDGSRNFVPIEDPSGLGQVKDVKAATLGDFDHDGDLDVMVVSATGLELWTQTGGLLFANSSSRLEQPPMAAGILSLACVDWDRDVDLDVVVANPHSGGIGLLENLRHGEFRWRRLDRPAVGKPAFQAVEAVALLEADGNVSWDVVGVGTNGVDVLLTRTPSRGSNQPLNHIHASDVASTRLIVLDWDNDGFVDLLTFGPDRVQGLRGQGTGEFRPALVSTDWMGGATAIATGDLDRDGDLDLVLACPDRLEIRQNQGNNGQHWLAVRLRGAEDPQSGRVNQYGIGSLVEARVGNRYQARVVVGQETHFGLGPQPAADSVRVVWTNGVPQVVLSPKTDQTLCERLALKGSCPYLYAWNGERFEFFTDLLWAAPLGLQFAEGVLAPSRAWEYLRVPGEALVLRDHRYELRITEELWEAAYFDQVELIAIDHPADVAVYSNEKVGPPQIAEYRVHTVRRPRTFVAARDSQGRDISELLVDEDGRFVKAFETTLRQGLAEPHYVELDFGPLESTDDLMLYLTGWIYPTDTALNVAISQDPALKGPRPPYLLVPDANGEWQEARPFLGFPGGKTKTVAINLSGVFPTSDHRVRIATTHEIYWDRAFFTSGEDSAEVRATPMRLASAELRFRGFSAANPKGENAPETYDYTMVSTDPKWPPMGGKFTRYGDVRELLTTTDDRLVVMASGDEISLVFDDGPPLPEGWKRDFFLHNVGWDKDADLHTVYGQDVEPLPFVNMPGYPDPRGDSAPNSPEYRDYLRRYQTRDSSSAAFWRWSASSTKAR